MTTITESITINSIEKVNNMVTINYTIDLITYSHIFGYHQLINYYRLTDSNIDYWQIDDSYIKKVIQLYWIQRIDKELKTQHLHNN